MRSITSPKTVKAATHTSTRLRSSSHGKTTPKKKSRILLEWKRIRLTGEMRKIPEDFEVVVLNDFLTRLKNLQKKLDKSYHPDRFIRDRFLTAIDVPAIQGPLHDRIPRTEQQIVQREVRRFSDKTKTAGT